MAYRMLDVAPLTGSFMITAILGFIISLMWVYPQSQSFGIAFAVVFALMFIASVISMTKSPGGDELQIDMRRAWKKASKK